MLFPPMSVGESPRCPGSIVVGRTQAVIALTVSFDWPWGAEFQGPGSKSVEQLLRAYREALENSLSRR